MSDLYFFLFGMFLGMAIKIFLALVDVAIMKVEEHVPRS